MSQIVASVEECVDQAIARVGKHIVLGAPLGLGKPVQLINAFYQRAVDDPSLSLSIYTALCLEVPTPTSHIEEGLAGPIVARLFGDYEELSFMQPLRRGELPPNVSISELYFKAGAMKNVPEAQQNYISSNYTHIARDMLGAGVNVMAQMVAARDIDGELQLSLSSNPDITLEVFDRIEAESLDVFCAAQIHADMPFMEHDAQVSADRFDSIVRNGRYDRCLFAVPNAAVPLQDYAAAIHASSLVCDGGTLQIGIGALGDALAHACILRDQNNSAYRALLADVTRLPHSPAGDPAPFQQGLYISTEMFVNGMMALIDAGIVKRRVYDHLELQQGLNSGEMSEQVDAAMYTYLRRREIMPRNLETASIGEFKYWGILPAELEIDEDGLKLAGVTLANDLDEPQTRAALLTRVEGGQLRHGRVLHGGFFLGPRSFYQRLREMPSDLHAQICMTGVRRTNQLLLDYPLYCAQRTQARFINTGMIASLNGAVASDALEDGTQISGVGGQYNFVAMAHDLPGARSVLCVRSTRGQGKKLKSNIVAAYGYTTIPKHLRDIIVTEYGIADLRGKSDAEVAKQMLNVADSRFQPELLEAAKRQGKLPADYEIPAHARDNTPEHLAERLKPYLEAGLLPDYPFGTELTEQEIALGASLRKIKALSEEPTQFISSAFKALLHHADEEAARPLLERVHLDHPETPREFIVQQLLMMELEERGLLKVS